MSQAKDKEVDVLKFKLEADGTFKRPETVFRNFIEKGGKFEPEAGRYHLYVSLACRKCLEFGIEDLYEAWINSLGYEDLDTVTVVSPRMGKTGWPFANVDSFPGAEVDPFYNSEHIKDLYFKVDPDYQARFSVPILWDKKNHTIVNNESSEIIRMLNTAFNDIIAPDKAKLDFYPENLRAKIDEINDWVYSDINNGVYRAGVATTQTAYEKAADEVFNALDKAEKLLQDNEYLAGNRLTEADIRLFVTTIRFDVVYHGHFKCNYRTIRDGYPAIHKWMQKLYWNNEAFKSTTDFDHIKTHYYWSHTFLNPRQIVPSGPIPHIRPL